MKFLSYSNAKTIKGEKLGIKTAILYLSPGKLSGTNLCPHASAGCLLACLNTAGMGQFTNVQRARLIKTKLFLANRSAFASSLAKDIVSHVKRSARERMMPAVRLNGTADVAWEVQKTETGKTLFELFPKVRFYDYTKNPMRALKFARGEMPKNYSLTFSRSEANAKWVEKMPRTVPIAVVFGTKKGEALPLDYLGRVVIDGDETDARFKDPIFPNVGTVVGLRSKGKGKKDSSGFVVSVN